MYSNNNFLRSYAGTDFITGLRAIAATMVVIIHTGALVGAGSVGEAFTSVGKYGVDIFFVISGFTIAKTFSEAPNYRFYLVRRLLRIAPLYYFLITLSLLLVATGVLAPSYWMNEFGASADIYNWLMHISFLSYLDYRVANSVLSVEWSIPIEIFWYVCLPFILFATLRLRNVLLGAFAFVLLTAVLAYVLKQTLGTSMPAKWSPIAYGHLFILGAYSNHFRKQKSAGNEKRQDYAVVFSVLAFVACFVASFSGRGELLAIATFILLAVFDARRMQLLNKLLANKLMLFIGSISYSIYLIHPLVISEGPAKPVCWFFYIQISDTRQHYRKRINHQKENHPLF